MSDGRGRGKSRPRKKVLLVFGESDNDRRALQHLVLALRPDAPDVKRRRHPLVLVRGRREAEARKNLSRVAAVVRADSKRYEVKAVVAHEDCDAVEPGHLGLSKTIEDGLLAENVPNPVAATPAWEIETWWFLWPKQTRSIVRRWRLPVPGRKQVGRIVDAKEALVRALRPRDKDASSVRDYSESDSPEIARRVRDEGVVASPSYRSDSWKAFSDKVLALRF